MQPSQGAPSHHFPYESSNDVAKKDPRAPCLMPAWEILISWYKLVIFYHLDVPGWKLRSMVGTWVIIPILILINGHARNLQVYLARNGPARVMHQSKTEDTGRPCCTGRPASLDFVFGANNPTPVWTSRLRGVEVAPRDTPLYTRCYNHSLGLERMRLAMENVHLDEHILPQTFAFW